MPVDLTIQPGCGDWRSLIAHRPVGSLFNHNLGDWRELTRRELGLDLEKPIIATGHQSLLWHPGILVKYMLTDAVAARHGFASANLVVDQHAGGYGELHIPVKRRDGRLAVRRLELTRMPRDEPMALHAPFTPPPPPPEGAGTLRAALPSVAEGVKRIHEAACAHRDAPNAALQLARALADLMQPWVKPMVHVTATDLLETSLSRALIAEMARDPWKCAEAYNEAVHHFPGGGIGGLLVRDDYVELPLWRIRSDRRRMYAYDSDAQAWLDRGPDAPRLMPRALFMTALLRLGMCDLFVHGTGGANYDRAMELWISHWLGVEPAPIAVATATLRLPLTDPGEVRLDPEHTLAAARKTWHDPEDRPRDDNGPGPVKREILEAINTLPRRSARRRAAFFAMHEQLQTLRSANVGRVEAAQRRARRAERQHSDAAVAGRRDWAFPLYPPAMLDELSAAVTHAVGPATAACE